MSEPVIYPSASVGAGATLDPNVYVGYPTGRHIAERTLTVGDGATLRTGTVLYEGSRIGAYSVIGSGAVVTEDVPPYSVVVGNPGRVLRRRDELMCSTGITDRPYGIPEEDARHAHSAR